MAHLKSCGEWQLENLDQSHPVVASATLRELSVALQEALKLLRCPLENKVERWMNGAPEFNTGLSQNWTPLREARHANLKVFCMRYDYCSLVYNALEVFQVSYRALSRDPHQLYHVQPLSAPEAGAYYLRRRGRLDSDPPLRLDAPLLPDFTTTRSPGSCISSTMHALAADHPTLSAPPEWEIPLHNTILSFL